MYLLLRRWFTLVGAASGAIVAMAGIPLIECVQRLMDRHYIEGLLFALISVLSFQRKSIEGYRDHLVELAEQMLADWQPGQVRNIFRDMTHYMLRVTSSILFGFDLPELAYEIGHMIERWVASNPTRAIPGFTWHHALTSQANGVPGVLQLVQTSRHAGPGVPPFWC